MNFTKPTLLLFAASSLLSVLLPADARGAAGDLYQMRRSTGSILKYTPGNGTPTTFASGMLGIPNKIAFNKAGELYAGEGSGSLAKIVKFSSAGVKTTFATGIQANGMACDDAGNLFVSDANSQTIIKITPAGVQSTFVIKAGHTLLDLMFDGSGNLLAIDYGASPTNPSVGADGEGKVYRFTPAGSESIFASGLDRPTCLATDKGSKAQPFGQRPPFLICKRAE
jgi:hypothetical protein